MSNRMVQISKEFLLQYFADGKTRMPSDFDWDILGETNDFCFFGQPPNWNRTPFFLALGELVKEGRIEHRITKRGYHKYKIKS